MQDIPFVEFPFSTTITRLFFGLALILLGAGIVLVSYFPSIPAVVGGFFCFLLALSALRVSRTQKETPYLRLNDFALIIYSTYRTRMFLWKDVKQVQFGSRHISITPENEPTARIILPFVARPHRETVLKMIREIRSDYE
jgi:hypothetical protein